MIAGAAADVSSVAEGADVVITLLADDHAVRRAYTELARTAAPGQVFVDMSPASVATLAFCSIALPAFVSARTAPDGSVEVRGEPAYFERTRAVWEAVGVAARHAGGEPPAS